MNLWVLRHGQAQDRARSDAERELTAHGRAQVLRSAEHLIGQPLEAIFASPYIRAQQTAELVREALSFAPQIITVPWLTPESDPLHAVRQLPDNGNVLLVSHQPFVGEFISVLQHGNIRQPQPMSTASLAQLQGEWPLAGAMTLQSVRHPY